MTGKMSRGARYAVTVGAAFVAAGIAYYFFMKITGLSIPCLIRQMSGLKCPTCGITHMFQDLFRFDFVSAFHDNEFLFCTWPFIGAEILYVVYRGGNNKDLPKWNYVLLFLYIALLLIFGIIRNII